MSWYCHCCNAVMWTAKNSLNCFCVKLLITVQVLPPLTSVHQIYTIFSCSQDSAGYPQKTVTLMYPARNQMRMAEFQVRKMVNSKSVVTTEPESEESQMLSSSSKRALVSDVDDERIEVDKRRRICSSTAGDVECSKMVTTESRDVGVDEPQIRTSSSRQPGPLKSPAWVNKYQLLDQVNDDQQMEEGEISEGEVKDVVERPGKRCCSHSQELEFVKSELAKVRKESKSRADEIQSLQKLVAALSRREGLA